MRTNVLTIALTLILSLPSFGAEAILVHATRDVHGFTRDSVRVDGTVAPIMRVPKRGSTDYISFNFGGDREVGGVILRWDSRAYPGETIVYTSSDGRKWQPAASSKNAFGGDRMIVIPHQRTRAILVECKEPQTEGPLVLQSIDVLSEDVTRTPAPYEARLVADARKGLFPGALVGQTPALGVLTDSASGQAVRLSDEGSAYPSGLPGAIEPFLYVRKQLLTWADASRRLDTAGKLQTTMSFKGVKLTVTPAYHRSGGVSMLVLRYQVQNASAAKQSGKLFLTVRPFGLPIGSAQPEGKGLQRMAFGRGRFDVNGSTWIYPVGKPAKAGISPLSNGDITAYLERGIVPQDQAAFHIGGMVSGAAAYDFSLAKGKSLDVYVVIPGASASSDWKPPTAKELAKRIAPATKR